MGVCCGVDDLRRAAGARPRGTAHGRASARGGERVRHHRALDMLAVSKYSELIVDAALVGLFMTVWRQIRARA